MLWYLLNLTHSTLTVCCDAPNHHLVGSFHSKLHESLLNSISQVGRRQQNIKYKNRLRFSGLSVSNSIDILREKLLVLMVLRDTLIDLDREVISPIYSLNCNLSKLYCFQVPQQTAEQRRDLALTFARQKAKERFMERNGK